jgi:Tfp pilus assembly protein PilX
MKRSNQKGAALLFAMIFVLVLSIMAASLMFLSQSETWASMNYRLMTQSRYGAEAGLHAAANYLMNNYSAPGMPGGGLITDYNTSVSPVTPAVGTSPIVLGPTMNGLGPNYPVSTTLTGFNQATQKSLSAGNTTVNYSVNAELISMRRVRHCLDATNLTAQLWKLTSHGDVNGVRNAEVEVSALLESNVMPCFNYAGFATGSGCGSIAFSGGGTIDSYNSAGFSGSGTPTTQTYMGNLGSNGNTNTASNTVINGTFSSPATGVGSCSSGGVTALSGNTTSVTGCGTSPTNCMPAPGLVQLPQTVTYPLPTIPSTVPDPSSNVTGTATLSPCTLSCPSGGANNGNYMNISLSGAPGTTVTFVPGGTAASNGADCAPGIYYINSLTLSGNASLAIGPCPGTGPGTSYPAKYAPVVINIVGQGQSTVLDLGGNGISNPSFNSSLVQFQYNGTGAINIHGNGSSSGVIYAPNAAVTLSGNGTIYGAVIGKTLTANGTPVAIHYDRSLQNNLVTVGNWTLDTFTWSKY